MNLYRITFDLSDVALGLLVDVSFTAPAKISDDELERLGRSKLFERLGKLPDPMFWDAEEIVDLGERN